MSPQEFENVYPKVAAWITGTLQSYAAQASPVASSPFERLRDYFDDDLLSKANFVLVDKVPVPPLTQMGLPQYGAFENGNYGGITFLDTSFIRRTNTSDELFFHELIHVIQWGALGPKTFLMLYAEGSERFGYADSPLEAMAYQAQTIFRVSKTPFSARDFTLDGLKATYGASALQ